MSKFENVYELKEDISANGLTFFFVSKGKQDIIKVIQYSYVHELNGHQIYNLGFGDYHLDRDEIVDDINTNNGDVYKVFNTVLSTIPIFFKHFRNKTLMVQASDSRPDFLLKCQLTCKKKCQIECKNQNRRINIYRAYVNKNFNLLRTEYQFLGGIKNEEQQIVLEEYVTYKKYDAVFLFKISNFTL